jgi:general secretion pathway protein G
VVVVIIGLLAAFVAPRYFDQVGKSSAKIAKAQITCLEQALDQSLRAVKLRAEG